MTVHLEPSTLSPAGNDGTADSCLQNSRMEPCTIVIFGASGDLTARKLLPALFKLHTSSGLPKPVTIVGSSRTMMTDQQFRDRLRKNCAAGTAVSDRQWEAFASKLFYKPVAYNQPETFKKLAAFLQRLDTKRQTGGNLIFYLAIPPTLYATVSEMIGQSGLAAEGTKNWSRIVVEKPFGRDIESATALEQILHRNFKEHQIFRIDHYLAKETVQNILMLRFANTIFEPLWNRNFIDSVGIVASEKLGVEHRAGYYEQTGVMRDMFQNHLMQLLALTAMEPPSHFEAARVQDEKVKVFRALRPFSFTGHQENLILGQYGPGVIDGLNVTGYRQEKGVAPASLTPTYAMMRVFIDNWRWQGVPFYMVSGKRLPKKITRVVVRFKEVPHSLFRNVLSEASITANRLVLGIHPREEIFLTFQTKTPGASNCLQSVTMDFSYDHKGTGLTLSAYEKVLMDCIQGNHMLFWRQDGVELSWSFLTPVLEACEICANRESRLHSYAAGSWGPDSAMGWIRPIIDENFSTAHETGG